MAEIPERQPVADPFTGFVLQVAEATLLAHEALPGSEIIASGSLTVRYAVEYLGKPHRAIVPGLVALDYGEMLTGEEAWEFLLHQSNLHPRADVVGYRSDGTEDMVVIKALDLAQPVHVLVYTDPHATQPIAQVSALITTGPVAPRLSQHLPTYPSIESWQAAHHE